MVSEGAIVCMLLDGHQLNYVVATLLHMRQYVVCKFSVLGNATALRTHTHMSLINFDSLSFALRSLILEHVSVLLGRVIEYGVKQSIVVLDNIGGPC